MTTEITAEQGERIKRLFADSLSVVLYSGSFDGPAIERAIDHMTGHREELLSILLLTLTRLSADREESEEHVVARGIMGKYFHGIPEVVDHFGEISPEDLMALQHIPYTEDHLRECAETHILFIDVGPPIVTLETMVGDEFNYDFDSLVGDDVKSSTEPARWRLIRKAPLDQSFSRSLHTQLQLIDGSIDELPSPRQIIYMIVLHYLVNGERLLKNTLVRTNRTDSNAGDVYVGDFDGNGLFICSLEEDDVGEHLGIAPSRKNTVQT
jgi:hypothetical protein